MTKPCFSQGLTSYWLSYRVHPPVRLSDTLVNANPLIYWLNLAHKEGLGPKKALERHFCAQKNQGLSLGVSSVEQPINTAVEADLRWQEHPNQHILHYEDPRYPSLLKEISSPPLLLYVRGNPECLTLPQIAIVGSRNPSPSGREQAEAFAKALSLSGFVITSGMAIGVDGHSHQGALAAGGQTIAVLGSGLDSLYPRQHIPLARQIAEQGAVVSEFPPEMGPARGHFPRRNRIISGLSLGVLVVEAAVRSGSLITAYAALEQGREVFAMPGSIHNPLARGCHKLIRDGAKLVENTEDILEELGAYSLPMGVNFSLKKATDTKVALHDPIDPSYMKLLEGMGFEAVSVDTLVVRTQTPASEVMTKLLELEVLGLVQSIPGGYTRIRRPQYDHEK